MSGAPFAAPGLVAIGAVMALDHAAWPSLLLAQPLCAGALSGALLGHFEAGTAAGAVVQMLFMGMLPVGGATVPEAWLGGMAAAVCVPPDVTLGGTAWLDDPRLAAPAVVAVLSAYGGRTLLQAQRDLQQRLVTAVEPQLRRGDASALGRLHATGLGLHALRGIVEVVLVLVLSTPVCRALWRLGLDAPAGRLALALAAVSLATTARQRRRPWLLVAGAALGVGVACL